MIELNLLDLLLESLKHKDKILKKIACWCVSNICASNDYIILDKIFLHPIYDKMTEILIFDEFDVI